MSDISREEWLVETKKLAPAGEVADRLIDLEQFCLRHTSFKCTYRHSKTYATFNVSDRGHASIIQIWNGKCRLTWDCHARYPHLSDQQLAAKQAAFAEFRRAVGGDKNKAFQDVSISRFGEALKLALLDLERRLCDAEAE